MMDYKKELLKPEYEFLLTNPHLGDSICILALGGSHAYGLNTPTSDLDIRGVALNTKEEILLGRDFEQTVNNVTDTTIYSIKKMFNLLSSANPNTVEILGLEKDQYLYITPIGEEIINNKEIFLSQKAINSFKGYSSQQLYRLKNALARDRYSQIEKEEHIKAACERAMLSFEDRYADFKDGCINLFIDKARNPELDTEIFVKANLSGFPLREFNAMFETLTNIIKDYEKLNHRNHKKDDLHLNKHAMHLVRLQLMALDLLNEGKIITKRTKDHDLLMSIRNGFYQNEDGSYKSEFFDMVKENDLLLEKAVKTTCLPKEPDKKAIEKLLMDINYDIVNQEEY